MKTTTYNLLDAAKEPKEGKSYDPDLIRVLKKEGSNFQFRIGVISIYGYLL